MTEESREQRIAKYKQWKAEGKIPAEVQSANKATVDGLNLDPGDAQAKFVEIFENPAIQAMGQGAWAQAARSLRSFFANEVTSSNKAIEFEGIIIEAGGDPQKQEKGASAGQWTTRGFGVFRSLDRTVEFSGPASFAVYGLPDDRTARAWSDRITPGKTYRFKGRIGQNAPKGVLPKGEVSNISITANDANLQQVEGGQPIDSHAFLEGHFPLFNLKDVLKAPKEYATYRIEGDLQAAQAITKKKGGMSAFVTVVDDSISLDRQLLTRLGGGLTAYLPARYVRTVNGMVRNSRVRLFVSPRKTAETDSEGKPTGNVKWSWNAVTMEVLFAMVGGTEVTDPSKVIGTTTPTQPPNGSAAPPAPGGAPVAQDIDGSESGM